MSTTLIVLGLLLSAVIGFFLGRMHGMSHRSKELSDALEQKEEELDSLQGNVKEHFDETARLFSNLTEEYKGLYQHLAKGATQLSGKEFQMKISPSNITGALDVELDDQQVHEGEYHDTKKAQQPVDYVRSEDESSEAETQEETDGDTESSIEIINDASASDSNSDTAQNSSSDADRKHKTNYATQETSQEHPPGQHSI